MKNIQYIFWSIIFYIILLYLQVNIFNHLAIFSIIPNLFIIYVVYLRAFAVNDITPNILAIIGGLIIDICFGEAIGENMLIAFLIINITPLLRNDIMFETKIGMMICVGVWTLIAETILGIIHLVITNGMFSFLPFVFNVIVCSIYNALIVLVVHPIFSELIKEKPNNYNTLRSRY